MYILAEPLALLIRPIYHFIGNYGWTLVIVTLLLKLATIPLTLISQRSTAKTQQLQPLIAEIQKKYANDKQKQSEEMSKLYTKYGINPMGGCLPMIVQMLFLFGFIRVVYDPLTYILQMSAEQVTALQEAVGMVGKTVYQVAICGAPGASEAIMELGKVPINFDFLGIDLTMMLRSNLTNPAAWIIPVLATLATVASSIVSKRQMAPASGANKQAAAMSNSMMTFMPIMTAYFTFIMPLGMSLYWFVSTLTQIAQQIIIQKIIKKEMKPLVIEKNGKKKK